MGSLTQAGANNMRTIEEDFVGRFARAWKDPTLDRLAALLHPDITFYQPHLPPIRGKVAASGELQRLLDWLPELYGEVDRFQGSDGVVFIEWRMIFPIGRKGVSIRAVDRVLLQDGLSRERAVYFNALPLIVAIVTHPRTWAGYLKYRFGPR